MAKLYVLPFVKKQVHALVESLTRTEEDQKYSLGVMGNAAESIEGFVDSSTIVWSSPMVGRRQAAPPSDRLEQYAAASDHVYVYAGNAC